MALANVNNQKRQVLSGLLVARPTAAVYYGDVYYATDNGLWYIYTPSGWVAESLPAIVTTLIGSLPAGTNNIGDVDVASLPGTVAADIGTMQDDIALIKAQNQTAKLASHSFVFDDDDLVKTSAIAYNGMVKHLHLVAPNFTNPVTSTVTLVDASGRIVWTSAAKAENASYNLESESEWLDQLVDSTLIWTVTLSGVAGAGGGTVVLIPRYYGV